MRCRRISCLSTEAEHNMINQDHRSPCFLPVIARSGATRQSSLGAVLDRHGPVALAMTELRMTFAMMELNIPPAVSRWFHARRLEADR